MLKHLTIRNYALIQELELSPSSQLNIITGETGAGKSIMLGAVGLMLGNRVDTKALFNPDQKCVVEGEFDVTDYNLQPFFEKEDLDYAASCIMRREISPAGKSRAFINDTPVNLETMRTLGSQLMDVHSQHDTLLLASSNYQLYVLDSFAENHTLVSQYKIAYDSYRTAKLHYDQLREDAQKLSDEADYNQFLFDELDKANLETGQQETLEEELKLLESAEEITSKLQTLSTGISTDEQAVLNQMQELLSILSQISALGSKYQPLRDRFESCLIELRDIGAEVENEALAVDLDPQRLEEVQNRLSTLYHLQQKHKTNSIDDLIDIRDKLDAVVGETANLDENLAKAEQACQQAKHDLEEKGNVLTKARDKALPNLLSAVETLLLDLGIPDAKMEGELQEIEANASGLNDLKLRFSANKGVKPEDLKSVASGGEFARLMFAIKYLLADKVALPTIIFDEIDNGISGEIALKLGRMMQDMAGKHQVITISHLPQIAAKGEAHYYVYKSEDAGRAVSEIKELSKQQRVEEIAKMIAGDNPTDVALESAKALILN